MLYNKLHFEIVFTFFVVLFQLVLIVREKKLRILLLTRRCTLNRENVDNILFSKLRKLKALKEIYFLCIPNNRTIKILCCYISCKKRPFLAMFTSLPVDFEPHGS